MRREIRGLVFGVLFGIPVAGGEVCACESTVQDKQ